MWYIGFLGFKGHEHIKLWMLLLHNNLPKTFIHHKNKLAVGNLVLAIPA